jgi:hypothetical protein
VNIVVTEYFEHFALSNGFETEQGGLSHNISRKELRSDLGWDTDCPEVFRSFLQSFQRHFGKLPQIKALNLSYKSCEFIFGQTPYFRTRYKMPSVYVYLIRCIDYVSKVGMFPSYKTIFMGVTILAGNFTFYI